MLGRSPKSISGQNNLITQRNTKKNNRQDNPADCFSSLCRSHNLQTMVLLSKPQLPTRLIRTKIRKKDLLIKKNLYLCREIVFKHKHYEKHEQD